MRDKRGIKYRAASRPDYGEIKALHRKIFGKDAFAIENYFRMPSMNGGVYVAVEGDSPVGYLCWDIAKAEGRPCGSVRKKLPSRNVVVIDFAAVRPDYRRRGICSRMLTDICDYAATIEIASAVRCVVSERHVDMQIALHRSRFDCIATTQCEGEDLYTFDHDPTEAGEVLRSIMFGECRPVGLRRLVV